MSMIGHVLGAGKLYILGVAQDDFFVHHATLITCNSNELYAQLTAGKQASLTGPLQQQR